MESGWVVRKVGLKQTGWIQNGEGARKLGRMNNRGMGRKRNPPWPEENAISRKGNRSIRPRNLGRACGAGKGAGAQTWAVALGLDTGYRNPSSVNPETQRKNCFGY